MVWHHHPVGNNSNNRSNNTTTCRIGCMVSERWIGGGVGGTKEEGGTCKGGEGGKCKGGKGVHRGGGGGKMSG